MRIQYSVKFKDPILLEDHWPVSIMGGELRIVMSEGKAVGLEISFSGQPVSLAPSVEQHAEGEVRATITGRDTLFPFVRHQLEEAFAYLRCYFHVDILIKEVDIEYKGETQEERDQIMVSGTKVAENKTPSLISFDLFTRAIMAAEHGRAPKFEAELVASAREAMFQERYIDSFRYSFLLIDFTYGDGQFKTKQLKTALCSNNELLNIVSTALGTRLKPKRSSGSDTELLLANSPTANAAIEHLVDKRGFFFHGNAKHKDAWKPHEQGAAEALALLSLEIALLISQNAAKPMFDETLSQRHFDGAKRVGAIMTMNVSFDFQDPDEGFDRKGTLNISIPGTKPTGKMAVYVAKNFLEHFEEIAPIANLKNATCIVRETGQKVFDMQFHVGAAASSAESD